uniref:Uncharacterized protein n=1 Tax=Timema bartmani TaxID=61472 RepID=A0A7R9F7T6_9NEOP|nr:unnamed protein product [Timema bartmani]
MVILGSWPAGKLEVSNRSHMITDKKSGLHLFQSSLIFTGVEPPQFMDTSPFRSYEVVCTCGLLGELLHSHSGDGNTVAEPSGVDPIILYAPSKTEQPPPVGPVPCTCGVFLSGQFTKNSQDPPKGHPALLHEHPDPFPCNIWGNKQCTNRCLDISLKGSLFGSIINLLMIDSQIVKHLPNSPTILCGSIDRDCHRERAYLFIKNCNNTWINTNLSAGREYCCKDGAPIKCPIL